MLVGAGCSQDLLLSSRVDGVGDAEAAAPAIRSARVVLMQLEAALAVMLAEGRSLGEAGRFASATAALTTMKLGAQAALPRREEVLALIEQAREERDDRFEQWLPLDR